MAKKTTRRKTSPPAPSGLKVYRIAGHAVEIRNPGEHEELWIDGKRQRFAQMPSGYFLYERAYVPPAKTLLEAVTNYLQEDPQKKRKHGRS